MKGVRSMEFSHLIAESEDGGYQPVEVVSSPEEMREAIQNYITNGPDAGWIAPDRFALWTRNATGGFSRKEVSL
jgi:hypothetical protein